MLEFAFFGAFFSSVSWLIYALMFINSKLADERLITQDVATMLMVLAIIFLPVLVIWMIFGYVNQFLINRGMNKKQSELLTQLQKNQDYTDLVVRVMLDAEHEIKDGFVLNKFDMFIADMNEALSEIIQRCNIASSAQLEQLWQRVRRGERWTLGKAILDANKNQSTFNAWVKEKVGRDNVFRGALLEFCFRYQNLLQLLEKHDRDRVFVRMIESGVFGKVYSIIAPMSDTVNSSELFADIRSTSTEAAMQKTNDYTSALKLATMEEPKADESIMNVDKNDETAGDDTDFAPRESLFSRFNPFRKKENTTFDNSEEDPFFQALHNSFHADGRQDSNDNIPSFDKEEPESKPEPEFSEPVKPQVSAAPPLGQLRSTLDTIRAGNNNTAPDLTASRDESPQPVSEISAPRPLFANDSRVEPSLTTTDTTTDTLKAEKPAEDEEDLVYPFGGWTDESNYGR